MFPEPQRLGGGTRSVMEGSLAQQQQQQQQQSQQALEQQALLRQPQPQQQPPPQQQQQQSQQQQQQRALQHGLPCLSPPSPGVTNPMSMDQLLMLANLTNGFAPTWGCPPAICRCACLRLAA